METFTGYTFPLSEHALRTEDIVRLTGPGFEDEILRINRAFLKVSALAGFTVIERPLTTPEMGSKISRIFEKSEKTALFVLTLGIGYEKIADAYRGDSLLYYLTDVIASEYTEVIAQVINRKIAEYASSLGLGSSNRYSPGYCGWKLSGQRALFSFLPPIPCGIELTDSCLMKPVKSISGAVAIGKNIRFQKYDCSICKDEICLYRKKFIL
ncbi:MAG: hypothetical protein A2X19_05020 [Bacteroidetes bacterium GWE2_39_28]|nr:MAG: hypothetical protein A2X19_05020 [Bacteroidetes bacterium GWE2_39_28]OFY15282.1 MAG: hypothetical protein A2X16_09080 [Bacteroidetes bacterium GWF2_39_10]OFZ11130.1 MAG: hypothetical protein A2465_02315 [Bacteroidetes bacterium RIFOXYC2_FULL_39_11]HCT93916.1 hypothetical protein [Rikenellaceae bacterium]HCV14849.1 hypothetical protein [Rikenellaceae bacterium]